MTCPCYQFTARAQLLPVCCLFSVGTYRPYSISGGSTGDAGCVHCLGYLYSTGSLSEGGM